jgi:choline monooxygenase
MSASVRDGVDSYNPESPLAEASTPPSTWYTDSGILEIEQRSVFSSSWQVIGRTEQVLGAGQYATGVIGNEPILIVRGGDGVLRGFFNVCRHHAAAVLSQPAGKVLNLRCPYHGWTYDLTGDLVLTPEFGGVANFDRKTHGLIPVQTAVWRGWVFVKFKGDTSTLERFLGSDLLERFERLHLEQFHWFERRHYTLNCNWKVFVDNYLDGGYHVPYIHGGLSSVLDNSAYTIETGERFCLQSSPISRQPSGSPTAAVRKGERALYFWIYPNFMINIYDQVMDTNLVIPRAVDRTEVIFDYYFADVSEAAGERNLASIAVSEQVQSEDTAICESVQRGLASRAYGTGRLSVRREAGEHLFHRLLHADLRAGVHRDTETATIR